MLGVCTPSAALAETGPAPPTAALPDVQPAEVPNNPAAEVNADAPAHPPDPAGYAAAAPPAAYTVAYTQSSTDPVYAGQPHYGAPPPPLQKPDRGFEMPPFSIRIDPFNWLLDGRLGIELEALVLSFMSVELVPVFVVSEQPPFIANAFEELVTQHSNGLGALAGTSVGVGFWFSRKALQGNVFRVIFTNYGMTYRSLDVDGERYDEVHHTERHLYGYLGSHTVLGGFFTIAGGIGLGVELNRQRRCFDGPGTTNPSSDCQKDQLQLARGPSTVWDLNTWTHPAQLLGRISIGVTF